MNHGSTHVWMYDCSDDEFVSETELQEGMWLSDSEEEPTVLLVPRLQPASVRSGDATQQQLEGSTTKYLQGQADDTLKTSDSGPPAATAAAAAVEGVVKESNYVEVEGGGATLTPRTTLVPDDKVEYVEIQHVEGGRGQPRPPATVVKPKAFSAPFRAGPPPPAPKRGIIKSRLAAGLHRLRKQRVRWDRSDSHEGKKGKRARRSDTNVLAVKFNSLTAPSQVHTGDAVVCSNEACTAILSHISQLKESDDPLNDDTKVWVCEFCATRNEVDIVPEEKPTKEDTTFMISAPTVVGVAGGGAKGVDDALVVFCIDVSGSMCVTTEVPGKFELKGHDRVRGLSTLNTAGEDQFMPRQRRDVTYVSRLQSVQAAVDHQLAAMVSTSPSHRAALVTFSDEVSAVGDGRGEVVTLAGDKLWSSDAIIKAGTECPLPACIKDTKKALSGKVFDLEEGGQTALGPALLLSISMAARVPGSKVIICTDGLANKGVGNLDALATDEALAAAQTFYEDMGTLALEKNVTVSLVRIKGTDCKALELGQVADKTGGEVTTVDPLTITKEFSSILANPIIATNVRTKIILHQQLYFRSEDSHESVLTIPVGNVTASTELSYEYGVRAKDAKTKPPPPPTDSAAGGVGGATGGGEAEKKKKDVRPLTINGKPFVPFQLQIQYTGVDGSCCMRVITQAKPVTTNRDVAERDIDMAVVGTHVAHTTAKLAMEGEYTQARMNALVSQRLMQRQSHTTPDNRCQYANLMEDIIPLEQELRTKQESETVMYGRHHSDDEDEDRYFYHGTSELMATELAAGPRSRSESSRKRMVSAPKKKKEISRRKEISDDLATYCYQMKSSKSSDYADLKHTNDDDEDQEEED